MENGNFAFVTLATDDFYGSGALVLGHSLKLVQTKAKLVVLITTGISARVVDKLRKVFDLVEEKLKNWTPTMIKIWQFYSVQSLE
ncbi:hypothetical protein CEXT_740021 [Caerostris extrusa]|uniref:Uncharacterized protein n=1 Tax=Caerostris extrusa TaxID=172846 RepID=A0AAV4MMQ7_CAEEX|nr:hypothetical protein CEXT_740021 [Caerostris extrusa]